MLDDVAANFARSATLTSFRRSPFDRTMRSFVKSSYCNSTLLGQSLAFRIGLN